MGSRPVFTVLWGREGRYQRRIVMGIADQDLEIWRVSRKWAQHYFPSPPAASTEAEYDVHVHGSVTFTVKPPTRQAEEVIVLTLRAILAQATGLPQHRTEIAPEISHQQHEAASSSSSTAPTRASKLEYKIRVGTDQQAETLSEFISDIREENLTSAIKTNMPAAQQSQPVTEAVVTKIGKPFFVKTKSEENSNFPQIKFVTFRTNQISHVIPDDRLVQHIQDALQHADFTEGAAAIAQIRLLDRSLYVGFGVAPYNESYRAKQAAATGVMLSYELAKAHRISSLLSAVSLQDTRRRPVAVGEGAMASRRKLILVKHIPLHSKKTRRARAKAKRKVSGAKRERMGSVDHEDPQLGAKHEQMGSVDHEDPLGIKTEHPEDKLSEADPPDLAEDPLGLAQPVPTVPHRKRKGITLTPRFSLRSASQVRQKAKLAFIPAAVVLRRGGR